MKQLKVSTRTNDLNLKTEKIISVMKSFPEGITPKELGRLTRINVNTIKSILPRLENVKKVMRGVYKVYEWGDAPTQGRLSELKLWNFHNCILTTLLKDYPDKLVHTTHSLKLINLEFVISGRGKATIRLSSDDPLNVSSICLVAGYFQELIKLYSKTKPLFSEIQVQTIEFNRDFNNLRLDGVKSITLDNLTEQFKVYQKKLALRIEHKTKVKFNVENVVDMLATNPNSLELNIKLSKQKEQLERLTMATSQNTQLMLKVIKKLNNELED